VPPEDACHLMVRPGFVENAIEHNAEYTLNVPTRTDPVQLIITARFAVNAVRQAYKYYAVTRYKPEIIEPISNAILLRNFNTGTGR
jgi:hypothetical protein